LRCTKKVNIAALFVTSLCSVAECEVFAYRNSQLNRARENPLQRKSPFHLKPHDQTWVENTLNGLNTENRLRQLFVHFGMGDDPGNIDRLANLRPGGVHRIMGPDLLAAHAATRRFMDQCEIPPFITADLEAGANHAFCMTSMQNQLGLAAANDLNLSRRAVGVMAREAAAMGFNWTFTPCIDVNKAMQSAIVGTRSYGSDIEKIASQAQVHMEIMQAHGIAATAKHWPGEGYDDRDQHLVTTINPLNGEAWGNVFGKLYRGLIDNGVMAVMSAHIALPEYLARLGVKDGLDRYSPASITKLLNIDLLREELGFEGLVVSDATPMAGLGSFGPRSVIAPALIENGCDVFLFSPNEEQDLQYLRDGLSDGRLSEARLDSACRNILTMKAALGLHRKSIDERILPFDQCTDVIKSSGSLEVAREVAEASVTLVKDVHNLLPLNQERHRRVCLIGGDIPGFIPGMPSRRISVFEDAMRSRGFEVTLFDPANAPTPENTDLVIYALAVESSLGKSRIFLDWAQLQPGIMNLMNRYWHDIPTMLVSFGHPYYLYDAPRMPCVINAYSPVDDVQRAVVARITGNAPFKGTSPVDAFAGQPDAVF
jgi:beta-N-acetylhexosaminidase